MQKVLQDVNSAGICAIGNFPHQAGRDPALATAIDLSGQGQARATSAEARLWEQVNENPFAQRTVAN